MPGARGFTGHMPGPGRGYEGGQGPGGGCPGYPGCGTVGQEGWHGGKAGFPWEIPGGQGPGGKAGLTCGGQAGLGPPGHTTWGGYELDPALGFHMSRC